MDLVIFFYPFFFPLSLSIPFSLCFWTMVIKPFLFQDPFLVISKTVESGATIPICKTEVLQNDLNPTWKPIYLNVQQVGSKVNDFPWILDSTIHYRDLLSSTVCITPFANTRDAFIIFL